MERTSQHLTTLARAVVADLRRADLLVAPGGAKAGPGGWEEAAIEAVAEVLGNYFKAAAKLEADAEEMAEEHLRRGARGRGEDLVGVDRRRMVQLIKERLAKERNFPL